MSKHALWNAIESRLDSCLPQWEEELRDVVDAVKEREAGRTWSDNEVFEALLKAVLSGNTDWSKIKRILPELQELFCGFSLEAYAALSPDEIGRRFVPWFTERKAGSRQLKERLTNLIDAAGKLARHSSVHGTAEDYFTSLLHRSKGDPKRAALELGRPGSEYKLPSLGVPLAAQVLKHLGFDVAKPDRHVLRAVGSFGLVHFERWPPNHPRDSELLKTMTAVEELAASVQRRIGFVDSAIWLLCSRSGLSLTNEELCDIARQAETARGHADGLVALIQSWIDGNDTAEQRETIEYLIHALDEDRLSDRKLFPRKLKGKSW